MRRASTTAAEAWRREDQRRAARFRCWMLTPTYAKAGAWRAKHVTELIQCIREHQRRRGAEFVYQWVAEIQEGRYRRTGDAVVHYHVLIWLPVGTWLPKPDQVGWWAHGMTNLKPVRNAVGYCVKYTTKLGLCGQFPRGLRLHGRGGMGSDVARQVRCYVAPRYVRERFGLSSDPIRLPGGGWVDRASGEVLLSSEVPRFTEWVRSYV